MSKQTIVGRVAQLAKADLDALLDQAEDPQKVIDRLIRDYTGNISEAEETVAAGVRNLRLMEQDHAEDVGAAAEWGGKALAASRTADALRASGHAVAADRFDTLARIALGRQWQSQQEAAFMKPTIAAQKEVIDRLRTGLTQMKTRLGQLWSTREGLVVSSRAGRPRHRKADTLGSVDVLDPTGELSRFEEKLRREQTRAEDSGEPAPSTLDTRFETLDPVSGSAEVEARLARLKSGPA